MLITHEKEKLLAAIDLFTKNTKYCGLTKLFKLLYFMDFDHFQETGRTVTNLNYYALPYGPVPKSLYNDLKQRTNPDLNNVKVSEIPLMDKLGAIDSKKKITIKVIGKVSYEFLTSREIRIINCLCEIYRDATATQISEISHENGGAWDITIRSKGSAQLIDKILWLASSKISNTALPRDELKLRYQEHEEIKVEEILDLCQDSMK